MASKKQGTSASAGSPIDFVSAAGTVRVQQNSISGLKLNRIDFGVDNEVVWAAEGSRVDRGNFPPSHPKSTVGRFAGLACTIPAGDLPHHNYSIDSDFWSVSFKAHIN